MAEYQSDIYKETSLGEIIVYLRAHLREQFRSWYLWILFALVFGGLGLVYYATNEAEYSVYSSFAVEAGTGGSSAALSSAVELAKQFGINTPKAGTEGALTLEYLIGIAQSKRAIKSSLLHEEEINGKRDILANHFINIHNIFDEGALPEGFKIKSKSLQNVTEKEDSVLTILFDVVIEDHLTLSNLETLNMNAMIFRSTSKQFAVAMCENMLIEIEQFFVANRIKQNRETVKVLEMRSDSVKLRLMQSEYQLAEWQDSKNRLIKAKGGLEFIELTREVEMLGIMSVELIANLETAKFSLLQNTPLPLCGKACCIKWKMSCTTAIFAVAPPAALRPVTMSTSIRQTWYSTPL